LYWKFARTSIWIEYFDEASGIPVPFCVLSILRIIWTAIVEIVIFFKDLCKNFCRGNSNSMESLTMASPRSPIESTSDGKCHFMKNQWFARKQHAQLMLNLIQRCYGRSKFQDINF
jgi:hypothetical protein